MPTVNPILDPTQDPAASTTRSSTPDSSTYHDARSDRSPSPSSPPSPPSLTAPNSPPHDEPPPRFPPEEEAQHLASSTALKQTANAIFSSGDYSQAISQYDQALAACPTYLDYEVSVLQSNIAACHLKLSDWKAAVASATAALDGLERVLPTPGLKRKGQQGKPGDAATTPGKEEARDEDGKNDAVVELDDNEASAALQLQQLQLSDQRRADIVRIRSKSLLRRARGKTELNTWGDLQGALDDYKVLGGQVNALPPGDRRVVQAALRELPARVKEAQEREVGEMMGKLKELGNGILKPFGLSTDMFKMQKDEKTGGYSMSVNTGGG
ncbi:uncharacterized protein KY384_007797 [Bacidia gigantensis]|uniref:uncharacterized protein n=1 Tax=Bacidia gigantensis TaxID=2732470 RepID=UPI001D05A465|nr:uncharacterized protein KY384_007797 [Bacidia gigantensis]KAG8527644.1 hypothetical protein KY384_007797 [Bacidia gigantensis]